MKIYRNENMIDVCVIVCFILGVVLFCFFVEVGLIFWKVVKCFEMIFCVVLIRFFVCLFEWKICVLIFDENCNL